MADFLRQQIREPAAGTPAAQFDRSEIQTGKYAVPFLNYGRFRAMQYGALLKRDIAHKVLLAEVHGPAPTAAFSRSQIASSKYGVTFFNGGRYRYWTLVWWEEAPVLAFRADGAGSMEVESWKFGAFQVDGQGGAEFLGGIRYFGAFQADGRTAVAFKAHLGGAFQCNGTADVEFLVPLPGLPQGLLPASGVPPPSNRKGRNYVF